MANHAQFALLPDKDEILNCSFSKKEDGQYALWISAYPASISLHLTSEQMKQVRDAITEHINGM